MPFIVVKHGKFEHNIQEMDHSFFISYLSFILTTLKTCFNSWENGIKMLAYFGETFEIFFYSLCFFTSHAWFPKRHGIKRKAILLVASKQNPGTTILHSRSQRNLLVTTGFKIFLNQNKIYFDFAFHET